MKIEKVLSELIQLPEVYAIEKYKGYDKKVGEIHVVFNVPFCDVNINTILPILNGTKWHLNKPFARFINEDDYRPVLIIHEEIELTNYEDYKFKN